MSGFCYEDMVQKALLNVVKDSLKEVEKNGFHGDHHFYISYRTDFPDVVIPDYLREKHPHEIMIVLQYQYENLHVSDDHFTVMLSFNGSYETLKIPFSAIIAFVDPSVKFGLQFTPSVSGFDCGVTSSKSEDKNTAASSVDEASDNIISFESFRKK